MSIDFSIKPQELFLIFFYVGEFDVRGFFNVGNFCLGFTSTVFSDVSNFFTIVIHDFLFVEFLLRVLLSDFCLIQFHGCGFGILSLRVVVLIAFHCWSSMSKHCSIILNGSSPSFFKCSWGPITYFYFGGGFQSVYEIGYLVLFSPLFCLSDQVFEL